LLNARGSYAGVLLTITEAFILFRSLDSRDFSLLPPAVIELWFSSYCGCCIEASAAPLKDLLIWICTYGVATTWEWFKLWGAV